MPTKSLRIPFTLVHLEDLSAHPVVQLHRQGEAFNLIVDTGASRTVLNAETFQRFDPHQLPGGDPFAAGINAQSIAVRCVRIDNLSIGSHGLGAMPVFLADLSAIAALYREKVGVDIHGLLGCDFFLSARATIDFGRNELQLPQGARARRSTRPKRAAPPPQPMG